MFAALLTRNDKRHAKSLFSQLRLIDTFYKGPLNRQVLSVSGDAADQEQIAQQEVQANVEFLEESNVVVAALFQEFYVSNRPN